MAQDHDHGQWASLDAYDHARWLEEDHDHEQPYEMPFTPYHTPASPVQAGMRMEAAALMGSIIVAKLNEYNEYVESEERRAFSACLLGLRWLHLVLPRLSRW